MLRNLAARPLAKLLKGVRGGEGGKKAGREGLGNPLLTAEPVWLRQTCRGAEGGSLISWNSLQVNTLELPNAALARNPRPGAKPRVHRRSLHKGGHVAKFSGSPVPGSRLPAALGCWWLGPAGSPLCAGSRACCVHSSSSLTAITLFIWVSASSFVKWN